MVREFCNASVYVEAMRRASITKWSDRRFLRSCRSNPVNVPLGAFKKEGKLHFVLHPEGRNQPVVGRFSK